MQSWTSSTSMEVSSIWQGRLGHGGLNQPKNLPLRCLPQSNFSVDKALDFVLKGPQIIIRKMIDSNQIFVILYPFISVINF
jgi:hypothetical protein